MQESQGCKPDCLDDSKSLSLKKLAKFVELKSFKYLTADWKQKDRSVVFDALFIVFFCGLEPHCFFSIPEWLRYDLEITGRGSHKEGPHSFNIQILIISQPWPLLESRLFTIFIMMSRDIWKIIKCFSGRNSKFFGSSLLLFGSEHCFAKKCVKKFSFFSEINNEFIIMKYWGNAWNRFLSFRNVLNIDK